MYYIYNIIRVIFVLYPCRGKAMSALAKTLYYDDNGEYALLSPLAARPFLAGPKKYLCAYQLYLVQKFEKHENIAFVASIMQMNTALDLVKASNNRRKVIVPKWDSRREDVMKKALELQFKAYSEELTKIKYAITSNGYEALIYNGQPGFGFWSARLGNLVWSMLFGGGPVPMPVHMPSIAQPTPVARPPQPPPQTKQIKSAAVARMRKALGEKFDGGFDGRFEDPNAGAELANLKSSLVSDWMNEYKNDPPLLNQLDFEQNVTVSDSVPVVDVPVVAPAAAPPKLLAPRRRALVVDEKKIKHIAFSTTAGAADITLPIDDLKSLMDDAQTCVEIKNDAAFDDAICSAAKKMLAMGRTFDLRILGANNSWFAGVLPTLHKALRDESYEDSPHADYVKALLERSNSPTSRYVHF